ncbi:MAG: hypothetical protein ABIE94_02885 [archaeon]
MGLFFWEDGKMDWRECNKKRLVKKVSVDSNLVASLLNSSSKKMETQKMLELNEVTAASKVSLAYDALRELLEAVAISNGYKIYNHDCYCAFLKEILIKSELGDEFDDYRKLRNQINYYGKEISVVEAGAILENLGRFLKKIRMLVRI